MSIKVFRDEASARLAASALNMKTEVYKGYVDSHRGIHDPASYGWVIKVNDNEFVRYTGEVW